eukprot:NODE_9364_length_647_cov_51.389313_g9098_i0.p1 GENE.NODE_9364_length_647_cov_51.389313_g9098_i0~~NODE_9364_length_647_cov_51.389313_g9098_i0.p1  ORF type:complete len:143 (-),score=0.82 NODE_9364_length_647_cov_51.389313_g9098_i0:52-480(-)
MIHIGYRQPENLVQGSNFRSLASKRLLDSGSPGYYSRENYTWRHYITRSSVTHGARSRVNSDSEMSSDGIEYLEVPKVAASFAFALALALALALTLTLPFALSLALSLTTLAQPEAAIVYATAELRGRLHQCGGNFLSSFGQ